MSRFFHGGDLESYKEQFHKEPLDFSAGIRRNRPREITEAMKAYLDREDAYPDPYCRNLTRAFRENEMMKPLRGLSLLWGNGATELFHGIFQSIPLRRVFLPDPCYTGYEEALERVKSGVTLECLEDLKSGGTSDDYETFRENDLLVVPLPNNPDGKMWTPRQLREFRNVVLNTNCYVLFDISFLDFCEGRNEIFSCIGELANLSPKVMIVSSLTKYYGLAGVRLGYMAALEELVDIVGKGLPLWNVSGVAQAAGEAIFDKVLTEGFLQQVAGETKKEKEKMSCILQEKAKETGHQITITTGEGNYLLLKVKKQGTVSPGEYLKRQGMMLREASDMYRSGYGKQNHMDDRGLCENLPEHVYRIGMRTPEENEVLIAEMSCWMEQDF